MQAMPAEERSKILLAIADALEANEKIIIHENEADVIDAEDDGYESSLISRLALKPRKASHFLIYRPLCLLLKTNFCFFLWFFCDVVRRMLQLSSLAKAIRTLAKMEEPIGQVLKRTEVRNEYHFVFLLSLWNIISYIYKAFYTFIQRLFLDPVITWIHLREAVIAPWCSSCYIWVTARGSSSGLVKFYFF